MDEREPTETTARSGNDRPDTEPEALPAHPTPGGGSAPRPGEQADSVASDASHGPDAPGDSFASDGSPAVGGSPISARPESTPGDVGAEPTGRPDSDGDYELTRPAHPTPPGGQPDEVDQPDEPDEPDEAVAGDAGLVPPAPSASSSIPPAPAGPPTPLHAPDPYGTPPYGQPGPWAPAPPVQHPAAVSPPEATLPAPPVPAPAPDTDPPAPLTPPAPARGAAAPPPPVPPAPPAPAREAAAPAPPPPAEAEPAPATPLMPPAEASPVPPPAEAPPAEVPPALPTPPLSPPAAEAPFVPSPAPLGVSAAPGAGHASDGGAVGHGSASVPPPPGPDGGGEGDGGTDPWGRYDPWAARPIAGGPLQESGGGLVSAERWRRRRRGRLVVGAAGIALLSGCLGGVVGAQLERNGGVGGGVQLPQAAAEPTDRAADSVAGIAARALPSVVTLHVSGGDEAGTGTGFVLDTRGHILTNDHVVAPAGSGGKISVVFNGGQTAQAEIVGRDSGYDLAVVRVTGVRGLKPLPLGNSDNVQVGDPVVAIGAPFDLEGTVTSGIISAKERPITAGGGRADGSDVSYVDALQTDAPINPGNSGGPLLDTDGRVIGINSAIRSAADGTSPDTGQAGSIGLGFAIPVNQGRRVAEELINTGRATHPVIGVTLDMDYDGDGARVGTKGAGGGAPVTEGGPADRAGIRPGDVITAVDGRPVRSGEELIVRIRAHRPGDRLELTVERDGQERAASLVLDSPGDG